MIANHVEVSKRKAKKHDICGAGQKKERLMDNKRKDTGEKVYPLSYYMHDKEEMVNQAFSAIGKKDLKALLFPAIEDLSRDELKKLCLGQLQEMSDRDIAGVLEGKKVSSSLTSPCVAGLKCDDKEKLCFKEEKANLNRDDVTTITRELLQCASSEATSSSINTKTEKCKVFSEGNKEKLLLEVLELEMRARAIRALLHCDKDTSMTNDFETNITP